MDVYEQISDRLQAGHSLHKWLASDKWYALKKRLQALPAVGTHPLAVAGRLDIAANTLYGEPTYDWVLLVYNGFSDIGSLAGIEQTESFTMSVLANAIRSESLLLTPSNFDIFALNGLLNKWELIQPTTLEGDLIFALDHTTNSLRVTPNAVTMFKNLTASTITFRLNHRYTKYSTLLDSGEPIKYPALDDVQRLFKDNTLNGVTTSSFYGLNRL